MEREDRLARRVVYNRRVVGVARGPADVHRAVCDGECDVECSIEYEELVRIRVRMGAQGAWRYGLPSGRPYRPLKHSTHFVKRLSRSERDGASLSP